MTMDGDARARLAALEQREAIADLLSAYCELVDDNDPDGIVALFAPDGVYDYGFGRVFQGHVALRELFTRIDDNAATSHHLSNVRVSLDAPGTAQARSVVYAHHVRRDGTTYELFGRYRDELIDDGTGWRFRRRSLRTAAERGTEPAEGLPSRYERFPRGGTI